VAYLVIEQMGHRPVPSQTEPQTAEKSDEIFPNPDVNEPAIEIKKLSKIILYYFYGNVRCPTCRNFEAFSHEAVQQAFAEELNSGRLQWQAINVEERANRHFINDYQLHTRSIIIVKTQNGRQIEWKNLERIWELVGERGVFVKYVQDQVRGYLEGS
jgi:hypothetical protein